MAEEVIVYKLEVDNKNSIKNMQDLIDRQKELRKQILLATDKGSDAYEKLRTEIKANQKEITNFNRDLRNSKSIAERVSEGVTKSFKQVGSVIAGAFAFGALVDFGRSIVDLTSTIEDGFARVNTVAQLSQEEMDTFKEQAIEIGKLGSSALEEIPDALFDIVSATGDTDASLEILETSVLAADAGFGDLGTTANSLVNIMNAVGLENISSAEAADILFATQKEGVASFDELAKVIPQVIPAAQSVGFSFEEVSASLATLTKSGLDANASGTSLRALFSSFTNKGKLGNLNSALQTVGKSVFDSNGELRGLTDIIRDFDEVLSQATSDEERTQLFANLKLDQNSIKALQGLIGNVDTFDQISESINGASDGLGELQTQLELSENGTRSVGKANNAFKAQLLELGQKVVPALEEAQIRFFEIMERGVEIINNTIDFFQENELAANALKNSLIVFAGFLGAKFLPNIAKMGSLLGVLGKAFAFLRSPITGVIGLFSKFGAILRANPIGLLITGLTVAITLWETFAGEAAIASSEVKKFKATSDGLQGTISNLNAELAKQVSVSNDLFAAVKDTTKSEEEREAAMAKINEQYGEYLPNQLNDINNLQAIESAQNAVNSALTRTFTLRIKQATQSDILTNKINSQVEAFDNLRKIAAARGEDIAETDFVQFQKVVEGLAEDTIPRLSSAITDYKFAVVDLGDEDLNKFVTTLRNLDQDEFLRGITFETGKFNDALTSTNEVINQLSDGSVDASKNISNANKAASKSAKDRSSSIESQYQNLLGGIKDSEDAQIKEAETTFTRRKRLLEQQLEVTNITEQQRFDIIKQISDNEKRLKLTVRDVTQKSLEDQLVLAEKFNKDSEDLIVSNELLKEKSESEFVNFVIKERKRLDKAKENIAKKELDASLTRFGAEVESTEREIKLFNAKFEKQAEIQRKAGVEEAQIEVQRQEGLSAIAESFGIKSIESTKRIEDATALIEFNSQAETAESKERFEQAKLQSTLKRQKAELKLLEQLGTADEVRLTELRAAISETSKKINEGFGQIKEGAESVGLSFKEVSDGFGEFSNKALEFSGKIQELLNLSTELAINGLDRQADKAQVRIDAVQGEINNIDERIANSNATQKAALLQERQEIEKRFNEEKEAAQDVEDEKERLRKEAFERNKTFSIVTAIINGALAITKGFGDLGPVGGAISAVILAGITAAQVATIASQKFAMGGLVDGDSIRNQVSYMYASGGNIPVSFPSKRGGVISGPSHPKGGVKFSMGNSGVVGEAQGGEFISSVPATNMFYPIFAGLNAIGNRLGKNMNPMRLGTITSVPPKTHFQSGGSVQTSFLTRAEFGTFSDNLQKQNNEMNKTLQKTNELLRQRPVIVFSHSEFEKSQLEFRAREGGDDD